MIPIIYLLSEEEQKTNESTGELAIYLLRALCKHDEDMVNREVRQR